MRFYDRINSEIVWIIEKCLFLAVDEKEKKNSNNPEKELADNAPKPYNRP